jgi:hypothetical protein
MSWLTDPQEAARHPVRTTVFLFSCGSIGLGLITYFLGSGRSLPASVAMAGVGGFLLALIGIRGIRNPDDVAQRASVRPSIVTLLAIGVVIAAIGLATQSWRLVAAATPLLALAASLLALARLNR